MASQIVDPKKAILDKLNQQEREALQEIDKLKEQAEDPRKIARIKVLL